MRKNMTRLRRRSGTSYAEDSTSSDPEKDRRESPPKKKLLKMKQRNSQRCSVLVKKNTKRNKKESDELWPYPSGIDSDEESNSNEQSDSNSKTPRDPGKRCSRSKSLTNNYNKKTKKEPTRFSTRRSSLSQLKILSLERFDQLSGSAATDSDDKSDSDFEIQKWYRSTSLTKNYNKKPKKKPTRFSTRRSSMGQVKSLSLDRFKSFASSRTQKDLSDTTEMIGSSINKSKPVKQLLKRNKDNENLNKSAKCIVILSSSDSEQSGRRKLPQRKALDMEWKQSGRVSGRGKIPNEKKRKIYKSPHRSTSSSDEDTSTPVPRGGTRVEPRKRGRPKNSDCAKKTKKESTRFSTRSLSVSPLINKGNTSQVLSHKYTEKRVKVTTEKTEIGICVCCPLNPNKSAMYDDYSFSSSDLEQGERKSSPEYKPPKTERKRLRGWSSQANKIAKEKRKNAKLPHPITISSDTDTKSDSDFGSTSATVSRGTGLEPRKRGRPKKSDCAKKTKEPTRFSTPRHSVGLQKKTPPQDESGSDSDSTTNSTVSRGDTEEEPRKSGTPKSSNCAEKTRKEPTRFSTRNRSAGPLKKAGNTFLQPPQSESSSDSDSGTSTTVSWCDTGEDTRRRGRPKRSNSDMFVEQQFRKSPVIQLKKISRSFLQGRPYSEEARSQRDVLEDTNGVTCPINISRPVANNKHAIHSTGNMAEKFVNRKPSRKPKGNNVNGHQYADDLSSSDQEQGGRKSLPRSKPLKMKKDEGLSVYAKKVAEEKRKRTSDKLSSKSASCSENDINLESDSDTNTTFSRGNTGEDARKSGRPKSSNSDKFTEEHSKKEPDKELRCVSSRKSPVGQLKKTGKIVLQDDCSERRSDRHKKTDSAASIEFNGSTTVSGDGNGKESRKRDQRSNSLKNDMGKVLCANKFEKEPPRVSLGQPPESQFKNKGKNFLQNGSCLEIPKNDRREEPVAKKPEKELPRDCLGLPPVGQLTNKGENVLQEGPCIEIRENDKELGQISLQNGLCLKILKTVIIEKVRAKKCEKEPPSVTSDQHSVDQLEKKGASVLQNRDSFEIQKNGRDKELLAKTPEKEPPQAPMGQLPVDLLKNKAESFLQNGPCLGILENGREKEQLAKEPEEEPPQAPLDQIPLCQSEKPGERFLQNVTCLELPPELTKCRECGWMGDQESGNNVFCRFFEFRKLKCTKTGKIIGAGFSSSETDATDIDNKLWLPDTANPPSDLDLETSFFLLMKVGDHFCDLLNQEKEAHDEHVSNNETVAWKRVVPGVREMCDVCETTLFNYHWTCRKCGFGVCLDCYKSCTHKYSSFPVKDRGVKTWLRCTTRGLHRPDKLMFTQIIADDCLLKLGRMVHEMRDLWSIKKFCGCPDSKESIVNNIECRNAVQRILTKKVNEKQSFLNLRTNVALSKSKEPSTENKPKKNLSSENDSSSEEEGDPFILRKLLYRPVASTVSEKEKETISDINDNDPLLFGLKQSPFEHRESIQNEKDTLEHFIRRNNWQNKRRQQAPVRVMTETVSKFLYPDIPHSWFCFGKLLRLTDPVCKDNFEIFQDQWSRGQPVIVSGVSKLLDQNLWTPEAFARDFGEEKNNLINCLSGSIVPNQRMRKFWDGFEDSCKRLKDFDGLPMLLKLKDWPPGEDFAEMLPTRFQDLMQALPMQDYTKRSGKLNLASRLPNCFVRPDLGPKMYNAYGKPLPANKGTTNLHLDVSDAVNVMVYVGVCQDGDSAKQLEETLAAIDEAGCDFLTRRRVSDGGELPGALWHIYHARDADKIRDLLNKATVERGGRLEPHTDPIHDQSGYLDGHLRQRLYKEYGVEGYAILQCQGDAVFIPAGAPHQVRNLNNCIKVAEDFVSPENVVHCSHLTQEFRDLSKNHSNHEDKLQIKNIIYHTVKDAVCVLGSLVNEELGRRVIDVDNLDS